MQVVIGTRGSRLALRQAEIVKEQIEAVLGWKCTLKTVSSKGDIDLISPLHSFRGQGVFTGHLEKQLLERKIDVAVHSLKDLPTTPNPALPIRAMLKRDTPNDLLIIKEEKMLANNPLKITSHCRIGTGSIRRQLQLMAWDSSIVPLDIRGNIEKRIDLFNDSYIDGIVMAQAVFERINVCLPENIKTFSMPLESFPTSPGQGVIAIQSRAEEYEELYRLNDTETFNIVNAERRLLARMEDSCEAGIGLTISQNSEGWQLSATYKDNSMFNRILLKGKDLQSVEAEAIKFMPIEKNQKLENIANKFIVIATDEDTASKYIEPLRSNNAFAFSLPVITHTINEALFEDNSFINQWKDAAWVVVSSKRAVVFMDKLNTVYPKAGYKIAAVGTSTARELRKHGFPVHIVSFQGMHELRELLAEAMKRFTGKVLYLSGAQYKELPTDNCIRYPVYYTRHEVGFLPKKPVDIIVFFSSGSANAIIEKYGTNFAEMWIAIGKHTASFLQKKGIEPVVCEHPSVEGVIEAISRVTK